MIFKQTNIFSQDRSGAGRVKVFHIYKKQQRQPGLLGEYAKGSVRWLSRLPPRIRGKRFRPIRVGFIIRCYLNLSVKKFSQGAVFSTSFYNNSFIMIKRRGALKSKHIFGPCQRPRSRLNFFFCFSKLI